MTCTRPAAPYLLAGHASDACIFGCRQPAVVGRHAFAATPLHTWLVIRTDDSHCCCPQVGSNVFSGDPAAGPTDTPTPSVAQDGEESEVEVSKASVSTAASSSPRKAPPSRSLTPAELGGAHADVGTAGTKVARCCAAATITMIVIEDACTAPAACGITGRPEAGI